MKHTRTALTRIVSAPLLALLALPIAARAGLPLGVAAGDTTQTSSVLWSKASAPGTISFDVATDAAFTNIVGSNAVSVADATLPAKWDVTGLAASTQY